MKLNRRRRFLVVTVDATVALPNRCANCEALASEARRETRAGSSLLIPYCSACAMDLARLGTTQLALGIASALLVVTLHLGLPWLWVDASLLGFAACVAAAAALPLALGSVFVRSPRVANGSSGLPVFWLAPGKLACSNANWATALANSRGEVPSHVERRERTSSAYGWLPMLLGLALAPSSHSFNYPQLVVLNFGTQAVNLQLGGRSVAHVEPTSLESRDAGARLRLAAGEHQLVVADERGEPLESHSLRLLAGGVHLLALESDGYCFWLERRGYGKSRAGTEPAPRRLDAEGGDPGLQHFWRLPREVDSWFGPNPEPSADERSSGGMMTALRHAPCDEAPAAVRPSGEHIE